MLKKNANYARLINWSLWIFLLFGIFACSESAKPALQLQGATMGTTWNVSLPTLPPDTEAATIRVGLEQVFKTVNDQMSTWQKDSELTSFNQYKSTDWFPVSAELIKVVAAAQKLSELSAGVYDITVGPLVNVWGFGAGRSSAATEPPSPDSISEALRRVGYRKLEYRDHPPALRKTEVDLYVDLSSIAKGYGVDAAADYLKALGIPGGMVEVGGEIVTWGRSHRGDVWRVAIEKPAELGRSVQQGIQLSDVGLATSGDYRNFFQDKDKRYSHMIDPRTGQPVQHRLASVSVIAENAMLADAYATLLLALGEERGLDFAKRENWSAYFIIRQADGFEIVMTDSFKPYLLSLK